MDGCMGCDHEGMLVAFSAKHSCANCCLQMGLYVCEESICMLPLVEHMT